MSDETANEQQGDLAQEILNRILADEDFRKQLLNNPAETLAAAGYIEGDDVSGYTMMRSSGASYLTIVPGPSGGPVGKPPIATTGINCGGGGGGGGVVGTTAINCGGGSSGTHTAKPLPPSTTTDFTSKA